MDEFRKGDIIEATGEVRMPDLRTVLRPGQQARVTNAYRSGIDHLQIIDFCIGEYPVVQDLVCFYTTPIRKVTG